MSLIILVSLLAKIKAVGIMRIIPTIHSNTTLYTDNKSITMLASSTPLIKSIYAKNKNNTHSLIFVIICFKIR